MYEFKVLRVGDIQSSHWPVAVLSKWLFFLAFLGSLGLGM